MPNVYAAAEYNCKRCGKKEVVRVADLQQAADSGIKPPANWQEVSITTPGAARLERHYLCSLCKDAFKAFLQNEPTQSTHDHLRD